MAPARVVVYVTFWKP